MRRLAIVLHAFALLGILFIPYPFHLLGIQEGITHFLFDAFLLHWPGLSEHAQLDSDSPALIALLCLLFFLSLLLASILPFLACWRKHSAVWLLLVRSLSCYYLSLQLLQYGLDKVFKAQFYLPEPNTLYTPFGQLSKDILFWSTMGTSYSYNLFLGIGEIIPALLLLFRRTRVAGLLWSLVVLIQVLVVDFSFGINVRLYAAFLLYLTLFLLLPQVKPLFAFFFRQQTIQLQQEATLPFFKSSPALYHGLKTFIIGMMLLEALFPYIQSQNFNDDHADRGPLHGAYEIVGLKSEKQDASIGNIPEIKRFFIHRDGYLIFQYTTDSMQDFRLQVDTLAKKLWLSDYQNHTYRINYLFPNAEGLFQLEYPFQGTKQQLLAKPIPWQELPALR